MRRSSFTFPKSIAGAEPTIPIPKWGQKWVEQSFCFFELDWSDLQTKIHNFAEERHINATSVVHQGLEENPWIPQNELRMIVDRVVGYIIQMGLRRLFRIYSQVSYWFFLQIISLYDDIMWIPVPKSSSIILLTRSR